MARTALAVQSIPQFGAALDDVVFTAADAANNHEFINDGRTMLLMKNDSGGPLTADVIGVANTRTANRTSAETMTAGASDICIAGPFEQSAFNQALDGGGSGVFVDLSTDTSLSFAVVKFFK